MTKCFFKIMRTIGFTRRSEPASVGAGNLVYAECADDFLDKIDIALQVAAITRNLPYSTLTRALALLQPEACENFVDCLRFNRDADDSIAFFVSQRNVCWIRRNFSGRSNFFCRRSARDLPDKFGRALRGAKHHPRIDPALEAITCIAW